MKREELAWETLMELTRAGVRSGKQQERSHREAKPKSCYLFSSGY